MTEQGTYLGVAEAKRDFASLIERVQGGEEVIVCRRGRPVLRLSEPKAGSEGRQRPAGLASVAGAMSDWQELSSVVDEAYRLRSKETVREVPDLSS